MSIFLPFDGDLTGKSKINVHGFASINKNINLIFNL